jgi:hypothetical protein
LLPLAIRTDKNLTYLFHAGFDDWGATRTKLSIQADINTFGDGNRTNGHAGHRTNANGRYLDQISASRQVSGKAVFELQRDISYDLAILGNSGDYGQLLGETQGFAIDAVVDRDVEGAILSFSVGGGEGESASQQGEQCCDNHEARYCFVHGSNPLFYL